MPGLLPDQVLPLPPSSGVGLFVTTEVSQAPTTIFHVIADYRRFINRDLPLIERGCTSKAAFVSRREARSLVRSGRRSDGSLDPYHCGVCGHWHLGHRRRRSHRSSNTRRAAA
jgi:hypothetical protein